MKRILCLTFVCLGVTSSAWAQPVVDGTADASYGAALSTQNARTGYGDGSGNGDAILTGTALGGGNNGGSEIDQVFGKVSGGRLYVVIAGNLEANFNKLSVYIDSKTGGVNQLVGSALPGGLDGFVDGLGFAPPKGKNTNNVGQLQRYSGLTFDTGFNADYALEFTHGPEQVNAASPVGFWAISAHYADLTQGTNGVATGLGMQLAPRGEPKVLRGPGDYNKNGVVDAADYTKWRDGQGATVTKGTGADGDATGTVDTNDFNVWNANINRNTSLTGDAYKPFGSPGNTEALINSPLPNLAQGQLIDRAYAMSPTGGGCTDDAGNGCVAKELQFALDVDPAEIGVADPPGPNASSHRNFNNVIGLQMALNNSNITGVRGGNSGEVPTNSLVAGVDDPQNVTTGIEFSIPLSALGNPTGPIKLTAMVGYSGGLSNQVAGTGIFDAGAGTGANLGGDFFSSNAPSVPPLGTFNDIPGNQFVTIPNPGAGQGGGVPEPTSIVLLVLGMLFGSRMLRRS